MVFCVICGIEFKSDRISKLACSIECEKTRKAFYDHDRYLEYRDSNRKKRREMLIEKYSISSTNLHKLKYVCEECETVFYYNYSIYMSFIGDFVSNYNTTSWGAACCPNCGLVEKSICDELIFEVSNMTEVERKLYLTELHYNKKCNIKKEAIYLRNFIDFISEAETVRKMLNRIYNKGNLTQDQINECIAILFRKIKELK